MKTYQVIDPNGILYQNRGYDYHALVQMTDAEAAPYLSLGLIRLYEEPSTKPGPLPEEP